MRGDLRGPWGIARRAAGPATSAFARGDRACISACGMLALGGLAGVHGGRGLGAAGVTRCLTTSQDRRRGTPGSRSWCRIPASAYYAIVPESVSPAGLAWWLAVGGLVVALGRDRGRGDGRRARGRRSARGWFWITLAAVHRGEPAGPLRAPIMAERFLYLPTVGFSLVLGWGAARLLGPVAWGARRSSAPGPRSASRRSCSSTGSHALAQRGLA